MSFSAEALPFCAREISRYLPVSRLSSRSVSEHVLESWSPHFPQWRLGWIAMLHSGLLQSRSPSHCHWEINGWERWCLDRQVTLYSEAGIQPTHVPGLEIYDVLQLRLFPKKKVTRAFLLSSKCGKTPLYIGSACISQHSLEGSRKTELFVQDTIKEVVLFGE